MSLRIFPRHVVHLGMIMLGFASLRVAAAHDDIASPGANATGTEYVYKTIGERVLHAYVYTPDDWTSDGRRSVMVFFHGGGWTQGGPGQLKRQARFLVARGMVCILVEYRLLEEKGREPPTTCIKDAKSAIRWTRNHAGKLGIDPTLIAAGGASAGGHLAAACATLSRLNEETDDLSISARPDALVLYNPVLDNGPEGGYGYKRTGERFAEFSPAHNVSSTTPPTIIMVGTEDHLIPVDTMQRFKDRMEQVGVRCDLIFYEGQGHGFFAGKTDEKYFHETMAETDRFLTSLGFIAPTAR